MAAPLRSADQLMADLHAAFPPADGQSSVRVEHVDATSIRMRMPVDGHRLRPGDTVSGPTLFALADLVAWLMTLSQLEPGRDAVTASISMQFLRRPRPVDLIGEGRLLRLGSRFSVTDVLIYSEGADEPVVQATVTYAPV